jgi:hypothetical protein
MREEKRKKKEKEKKKKKKKRGEMVLGPAQYVPVGSHPMSIHSRTLSTKDQTPPATTRC